MAKKKKPTKREIRSLRLRQLLFISLGVILILSMVLAMLTSY
jgi:hypothetical protein